MLPFNSYIRTCTLLVLYDAINVIIYGYIYNFAVFRPFNRCQSTSRRRREFLRLCLAFSVRGCHRQSETASFFVDVKCILELISLYTAFYKFIFNSHCLLTVYESYVLVSRDGNYARIGNDIHVYVCAAVAVSVNFKNF